MTILLALGVILAAGLLGAMVSRRLGFPSITGYIIVGLLLGPSASGLIPRLVVVELDVISWLWGMQCPTIASGSACDTFASPCYTAGLYSRSQHRLLRSRGTLL